MNLTELTTEILSAVSTITGLVIKQPEILSPVTHKLSGEAFEGGVTKVYFKAENARVDIKTDTETWITAIIEPNIGKHFGVVKINGVYTVIN